MLSEAVRPRLDGDDPEQYLSAELEHLPETTHAVHVVDTGTNTVVATTQGSERSERYTRVEFESASGSETDVVMSDPYVEDSRELLGFASVVPGRERAVVVTAGLDALASLLHSPIEGGETSVVAADSRTTVLSSNASGTLTAFSGYAPAIERGSDGEIGPYEDGATVGAYAPVAGTDWVVVSSAPTSNAYALVSSVTRDFAIVVGIALAGFLLVGVTMGRSTGQSLQDLANRATALARGDVETETERTTGSTRSDGYRTPSRMSRRTSRTRPPKPMRSPARSSTPPCSSERCPRRSARRSRRCGRTSTPSSRRWKRRTRPRSRRPRAMARRWTARPTAT